MFAESQWHEGRLCSRWNPKAICRVYIKGFAAMYSLAYGIRIYIPSQNVSPHIGPCVIWGGIQSYNLIQTLRDMTAPHLPCAMYNTGVPYSYCISIATQGDSYIESLVT